MTIVFLRIESLKGHERVDRRHLLRLENRMKREGVQRDPIVVDRKTKVVLDGHHRMEIFRRMGLKKIAAYQVDYLADDGIEVKSWYPVLMDSANRIMKLLGVDANARAKRKTNPSEIFLISRRGKFPLRENRFSVMRELLGSVNIHYSPSLEQARRLVRSGRAGASVVLPNVKKEEVMKSALSGVKFPPKTTRHIIPHRPTKIFLPLQSMK